MDILKKHPLRLLAVFFCYPVPFSKLPNGSAALLHVHCPPQLKIWTVYVGMTARLWRGNRKL